MTPLDKFGQLVMRHLRDRAIGHHLKLQAGEWSYPAIKELQAEVVSLQEDEQRVVLKCVSRRLIQQHTIFC